MRLRALAIGVSLLAAHAVADETYAVMPANPQAGETVVVTLWVSAPPGAYCSLQQPRLSPQAVGSDIFVSADTSSVPGLPTYGGWCRAGLSVTLSDAGTYAIHMPQVQSQSNPFHLTNGATLQVHATASTASAPAWRDLHGNWFDPAQSGWGMNIVQGDSGSLFAALMTYQDTAQNPTSAGADWLVLPAGRWVDATTFRGAMYAVMGSAWGAAYDPSKRSTNAVGFATLAFTDDTHVQLKARYLSPLGNVIERSAVLQRFAF